MANTGDVKVGTILRYNGELCLVTEYIHRTPGNLRAFYQAKMKNLKNGKVVENRFRAGEEVDIARVEFKELQFIYLEGDSLVVMDNETFEQVYVPAEMFGEGPTFVELEITYTEPGVKGDTATSTLKQATVETGAIVNVPLFVNQGEIIKIDTRDWSYAGKVK